MKKPASVLKKSLFIGIFGVLGSLLSPGIASALELDWSGQFWSEYNFIHNYSMDASTVSADPVRSAAGGYYIPGGGANDASFQSLFLRLRPKLVVNDNIYIKSELWFGDPIFGMFGNAVPYTSDQHQYYSSQSRGSSITAQRFWGEFLTDVGTVQVGRVPLNWGLGIVWDSGDDIWDRYMSTGDAIRWIAKFGSFSFIPSIILSSTGNTVGGACLVTGGPGTACNQGLGSGGVVDYSVILKFENTDDEFEAGVNLMKRLAGPSQNPGSGLLVPGMTPGAVGGTNLLTYDFYAKKKFDKLVLMGEVPLMSGSLGGSQINTFALAGEAEWKPSDTVEVVLKAGYAPGQSNADANGLGAYNAFYFNPNYHLGMIMFNYQLANLGKVQTRNNVNIGADQLSSPYDNPIVNAAYLAVTVPLKPWDKWTLRPGLAYASALQTASASAPYYFNYWQRSSQLNKAGKDQGSSLGVEADMGVTFQWDDYFQFSWDNGIFFPGSFYAFSNVPGVDNATAPVFATSVRIGVNF
ncbi:MAG: hypothetical protein ABIQ95_00185 [Bdellovibrionia bacterium]